MTGRVWLRLSPAARAAAHGPICAPIGNGVDEHFSSIIVNNEGNDSFAPRWDGTQTGDDVISEAALMRRSLQRDHSCFNLGQLSRGDIGTGVIEDPARDSVKVTRDEGMVSDAIVQAPRAAPMVRRAAAKASSWSMNASRGVSMRARIS